jgi:hypothetical protein
MNIYWGVALEPTRMGLDPSIPLINYFDPKSTLSLISEIDFVEKKSVTNFFMCPAFKDQTQNTFRLKFPFDYRLEFSDDNGGTVSSPMYDQKFFDSMVHVRSVPLKMFSFNLPYIFIAEDDRTEIEATGCYFSDNDFVNKTRVIPGQFNIGKWYRPLDCAFMVKNNVSHIDINRGDDYAVVKFLTDKKINLKKFYVTDKISNLIREVTKAKDYKNKLKPLNWYYSLFQESKIKSIILKEINNNLME